MSLGNYNITSLVFLIIILYLVFNFIFNKIEKAGFKKFQIPSIFGLISVILIIINNYLWSTFIINPLLIDLPVIEGNYSGNVQIKHLDESHSETSSVKVNIKQTGTSTYFDLYTEKGSHSHSIVTELIKINEIWYLYQIYSNENNKNAENPNKYEGTCKFEINDNKNSIVLQGRFYTDESRKTYGTVYLEKKK